MNGYSLVKYVVALFLLLNVSFLVVHFVGSRNVTGDAFYLSDAGPEVRDPTEEELPPEMQSINTVFWSVTALGLLVALLLIHFWEHHALGEEKSDKH